MQTYKHDIKIILSFQPRPPSFPSRSALRYKIFCLAIKKRLQVTHTHAHAHAHTHAHTHTHTQVTGIVLVAGFECGLRLTHASPTPPMPPTQFSTLIISLSRFKVMISYRYQNTKLSIFFM